MKEFIAQNILEILSYVTMIVVWVLGKVAKKSTIINNNFIPFQSAIIGLIAMGLYYYATGDLEGILVGSAIIATYVYDAWKGVKELAVKFIKWLDKKNKNRKKK